MINKYENDRYNIDFNLKNGLGKPSISLYLAGCDKPVKCKGCHNYELQTKNPTEINMDILKNRIKKEIVLAKDFNDNITFCLLGGEPLTEYNRNITLEISKYIKTDLIHLIGNIPIVLYTWRELNDLMDMKDYIKYIDYGVLGAFEIDKLDNDYLPSSENQYIYDFKNKTILPKIKLHK